MTHDLLIALIGFAVASSVTPGPNNLLVKTSGVNYGIVRTLPLIFGIRFGFMLLVVGIGLGSLIQASPGTLLAVKIFGLCYMLWLAWKVATTAPHANQSDENSSQPLSALSGALFQWVNAKAWAVALSAIAAFLSPDALSARLSVIVLVFALVAITSLCAWALFGTIIRRVIDTPSKMYAFNTVMALLLVASAMPVVYEMMALS